MRVRIPHMTAADVEDIADRLEQHRRPVRIPRIRTTDQEPRDLARLNRQRRRQTA